MNSPSRLTHLLARTVVMDAKLPSFAMGGRPTRVIAVGAEFAVLFEDDGSVLNHFTYVDPADAAIAAQVAAKPPEERDEGDCPRCSGHGCNDCLDVNATAF